jgi:hypothetical protein
VHLAVSHQQTVSVAVSHIQSCMQLAASHKIFLCHVAASHMQIIPEWPPIAVKFPSILFMLPGTGGHAGTICMQWAATWVQFECDWPPVF